MSGSNWALVLAAALLFVALALPLRMCLVDDSYIHIQYARNLAETGELSFNRGDPTYGATSPLWVFVLSIVCRLGGDPLFWCRALSWIFAVATIALLYRVVLSVTGRRGPAFAAALVMAAEAWFVRWSAVGMETSFAVFMVLAACASSFHVTRSCARSAAFGLLLTLAVLSRPEAMLLVPLALIVFLPRRRPALVRIVWLAVFAVCFGVWLLVIKRHTGTYLPLTAGAKQGRPVLSAALLVRIIVPVKIMGVTLAVPWMALLVSLLAGLASQKSLLLFLSSAGEKGASGAVSPPAEVDRRAGMLLALLWVFALPVVYVLFDFQVLSRYLVPVSPVIVMLGVVGMTNVMDRYISRYRERWLTLAAFTAVVVMQNAAFYGLFVVQPTREFSRGIREVLVPMGRWLAENTDRSAVVACPDIGAIGYTSRRRVLDLGGLVTPEINRMRQTIDVERIIAEGLYLDFEPDFLVDRSAEPARFDGRTIRGVRFTALMRGTVGNLGIRKPEPVVYALYRLERLRGAGGEGE
jgi:4-amino-4-deoxy-L-arabinose transferase-like glycosyltransferase